MIQVQIKLKLSPRQDRQLNHWLQHLGAVWNWAIKRIEREAELNHYLSYYDLVRLLTGHGSKIGVPQKALRGTLETAHTAWQRCFKKLARKPRFKSRRNRLNSIAFACGTKIYGDRMSIPLLGRIRFHKQDIPEGHVGQFRIVKRASGWYACLFIQVAATAIPRIADGYVGADPGFHSLLTLSTGEKVAHPRELGASARRLAQAQRGRGKRLAARLHERIANQRKDRNHKLSRRLVSENQLIAFSADNHKAIAKRFGKSVSSSGHAQLRQMLSYKSKCRTDGLGVYVEVDSRNSTKTCSACGCLSGPTGLAGLKVKQWTCSECGATHDRDINAARNTLLSGLELAHETLATAA